MLSSQQTPSPMKPPIHRAVFFVVLFIISTILACSFSAPSPSQTQTPEPVQAQTPPLELITIQTGSDPNEPTQVPPYSLATGHGHYLLYIYQTRKLIYDGSEVYSGRLAGLDRDGMALSHNGLHYAYIIQGSDGPDFNDLYVDGVKVMTAQYLSRPAVTDDGQHYFYTGCNSENAGSGICLFKDDRDVFLHENGILAIWISEDGTTYYASLRNTDGNGNFVESLVRNGEEIYKERVLVHKLFSPNGRHFAYVTVDPNTGMQSLIVDGTFQRSSSALLLEQITDLGSYCVWDSAEKQMLVNGMEFPVTGDSQIGCYINSDASHWLIHDGDWFLDGKPTPLLELNADGRVWDVEMNDDVWYIYRLVK